MKLQPTTQTLNSGILAIYRLDNTAAAGKKPEYGLTVKEPSLRYQKRTVGMNRYWRGRSEEAKIDLLVRCDKRPDVNALDVVIIDTAQYKIVQLQDIEPFYMDLSLERLAQRYELNPPLPEPEEGGDA